MSSGENRVDQDRTLINHAKLKGPLATLGAYTKLSGPGWLQSAITLGGGSLGGSLYLGVLVGFSMMWLQPLAMILGVVMLSAIAYVTLSTGEKPFRAINQHINPVLGWSWLVATMLANMVWCMPQFSLGSGAFTQNLFPGFDPLPDVDNGSSKVAVAILFFTALGVVWSYNSGSRGVKFFETLLKILVGIVVISFFGVVIKMALSEQGLPWSEILAGFIPSGGFTSESPKLTAAIQATGQYSDFWRGQVVDPQIKTMLTAAATAVGINMTFLLPYSMLRRGWDKDFRGLAVFDLATGLIVPYMLATSCVVIASASQFHAQPAAGFLGEVAEDGTPIKPAGNLVGGVNGLLDARIRQEIGSDEFKDRYGATAEQQATIDGIDQQSKAAAANGGEYSPTADEAAVKAEVDGKAASLDAARKALPEADIRIAAILVKRDNQQLAGALEQLTGKTVAHLVFGIGVLAMALSTIIILMLINGFALCEALGHDPQSNTFRVGCLLAGLSGSIGAETLWSTGAKAWLVVPTSMFGFALLPIAYVTFFCMMNSKSLLGENMPRGINRLKWNSLMTVATGLAIVGSFVSIYKSDTPVIGFSVVCGIVVLALIVQVMRGKGEQGSAPSAPADA
jgi:Mn2+/Fe2+ NRAMP family transporter